MMICRQLTHLFCTLYLAATKTGLLLMQEWRKAALFYSIIAMMGSLFFSRALLSIFMILFCVIAFLHPFLKQQLKKFLSTPFLWAMSLLFLLPLISGAWSGDQSQWRDIILIKVPLLFMPLGFASPFSFSKKKWVWLGILFTLLIFGAVAWSLLNYVADAKEINEGYLRAKSLITPLENDHVRFSWLVSTGILVSCILFLYGNKPGRKTAWPFLLIAAVLVIYLHILAARTGLISFYISIVFFSGWLLLKKQGRKYGIGLLVLTAVLPIVSYFLLPSFRNKIRYFLYDRRYFREGQYLPGTNDAMRVISMKAGWSLMLENKVKGVGFGDIQRESNKWYLSRYPAMKENDMIYPSSEWLIYGAGCGLAGFFFFSLVMLLPFFIRVQYRIIWWILNATAAFSFIADIGLETQFGVFIYSFTVLCCWKWQEDQKT